MLPFNELLLFAFAALILVITPGPNMIYLISRSITQGKKAGLISLAGVICGFLFHITLVSFGLTALLLTIPFAYTVLKTAGVLYLLYLAYQAVKPNGKQLFVATPDLPNDNPRKLFSIGFLTNVLNPKVAVFYLSFFPQFIKPQYGSIIQQSFTLGFTQISVSFMVNIFIVLGAANIARFFNQQPSWVKVQKWFMASILTGLALKMAFTKVK